MAGWRSCRCSGVDRLGIGEGPAARAALQHACTTPAGRQAATAPGWSSESSPRPAPGLPTTLVQQAEEAALRPRRARIVLRERRRRDRRHTEDFFHVVLTNQPGEEGTW